MKKNAFTLSEVALILIVLLTITAVCFPVFERARQRARYKPFCQGNLKNIGLSRSMYAQDYDEKSPLVTVGQQGWVDLLKVYYKDTNIFGCPLASSGSAQGTTDYFYNARLSGQPDIKLPFAATTIMFGDGLGAAPLYASLTQLPPTWRHEKQSPARRHRADEKYTYAAKEARGTASKGANYCFADGHVQWLEPERVSDAKASSSDYSFAPW